MYGCESRTIKKAEHWWIDAFELWCWKKLLRIPWTARSNQSILKETSPGCSLEGLRLRLKLQYFGHLMQRVDSFEKTLMLDHHLSRHWIWETPKNGYNLVWGRLYQQKPTSDWVCCELSKAGLPHWLGGKETASNEGDTGLTPGLQRFPGEGNGNPLQYSCLGNLMDREAWQAAVHGVAKKLDRT